MLSAMQITTKTKDLDKRQKYCIMRLALMTGTKPLISIMEKVIHHGLAYKKTTNQDTHCFSRLIIGTITRIRD